MKARNKHVLITAGPTREHLDPMRFISNPSSGKMGYAIAEAALRAGCTVDLVSGPVYLTAPEDVELHNVVSAQEMLVVVDRLFAAADCFISVAAVSDWRPARMETQKVKKDGASQSLELVSNPDILKAMSARKQEGQIIVGFCAETEDLEMNAHKKLKDKSLDWIAGNLIGQGDVGFQSDSNELMLLGAGGQKHTIGPGPKHEIASELLRIVGLRP